MNTSYARPQSVPVAQMLRTMRDDRGQGLAEYALILGFIAVLCIAAVAFFGDQMKGYLFQIGSSI